MAAFEEEKRLRGILVCIAPAGHTGIVWNCVLATFCSYKTPHSMHLSCKLVGALARVEAFPSSRVEPWRTLWMVAAVVT